MVATPQVRQSPDLITKQTHMIIAVTWYVQQGLID